MRLATFNVENMFDRAKAMNLGTWADGKGVLEDFQQLNTLIQELFCTDAIKNIIAAWYARALPGIYPNANGMKT